MVESKPAQLAGRLPLGDVSVARLGFGAMQLPGPGVWGPPADRDGALAVLRRAVELGVEYIDTSDFYGPHVANELIREALHPYPTDVVVGTKVGVIRDEWKAWTAAASPDQLREQVEENLARLGKSRLELVYFRVGGDGLLFPDEVPFSESFKALVELRDRGLIRNLGVSGVTADQLAEAQNMAPVVAVQNRFNLLDRSSAEVLRQCEQSGTTFIPYFPLAAGVLRQDLDKSQVPPGMGPNEQQEQILDRIAAAHDATRAQVAIAWLLAHSPVILAIAGTKSEQHLVENLDAAKVELSPAEVTELNQLA